MEATKLDATIDSHTDWTLMENQPVRICQGALSGLRGAVVALAAPRRGVIALQQGVCVEIDQSCLEPCSSS